MADLHVVIIDNDGNLYPSRLYPNHADAVAQLLRVREAWAKQYGSDGFMDTAGEGFLVEVIDGPRAQLFTLQVHDPEGGDWGEHTCATCAGTITYARGHWVPGHWQHPDASEGFACADVRGDAPVRPTDTEEVGSDA